MTAIPSNGTDSRLTVVCDNCGQSRTGADPTLGYRAAWLTLWQHSVNNGWTGRDRPVGPHYCPSCAPVTAPERQPPA